METSTKKKKKKKKKKTCQTMMYIALHRKLNIEAHVSHKKTWD